MSTIVGIDPGLHTGMALVINYKSIVATKTVKPWDVISQLMMWQIEFGEIDRVYMEDPRQNKPVFGKKGNNAVLRSIAQKVGSNKRDVDWLEHLITDAGFNLVLVKPTTEKWNKETLKIITGFSEKSNEHVRDAIKLAYAR